MGPTGSWGPTRSSGSWPADLVGPNWPKTPRTSLAPRPRNPQDPEDPVGPQIPKTSLTPKTPKTHCPQGPEDLVNPKTPKTSFGPQASLAPKIPLRPLAGFHGRGALAYGFFMHNYVALFIGGPVNSSSSGTMSCRPFQGGLGGVSWTRPSWVHGRGAPAYVFFVHKFMSP